MNEPPSYRVEPIPAMRRFSLDAGYLGRRRHIVHGLIEVDVTQAREHMRTYKARTGETLSFTAFVVYCLSRAIESNPHLHAHRDWRNRLVIFDDVNINTMIEVELDGRRVPMPHILEATNRMTVQEIHDRFRTAKRRPEATAEQRFMRAFLILPAFVRRIFYAFVMRFPTWSRRFSSSVLVTAVGMFGRGGGWALTMPNFTLTVAVGGIQEKPAVVDGEILIREILNLTVSVDHDIVDGGPIARFVSLFRELLEAGSGLE